MQLAVTSIDTPLGRYVLAASGRGLVRAVHEGAAAPVPASIARDAAALRMLAAARDAYAHYFAGSLTALDALAIDLHGSEFQRRVWRALREIPAGATASYGEIARRVGSPGAARAVGDANRRNPIAIAVPCHRVIGGDGRLVGYAGGLSRKQWLLAHEAGTLSLAGQAASSKSSVLPRTVSRSRSSAAASI